MVDGERVGAQKYRAGELTFLEVTLNFPTGCSLNSEVTFISYHSLHVELRTRLIEESLLHIAQAPLNGDDDTMSFPLVFYTSIESFVFIASENR